MEKIAENRFSISKSLYMEGMLRLSRDSYVKSAAKAILVVLGLWCMFFLYAVVAKADLTQPLGILFFICLAGLWICFGIPRSNARRSWRALEGKYGSDLHRTTSFYPDHLEILGEGLEKHIPYEDIIQIKRSRRVLVLVCKDKTGVLLALDGFTLGTVQDVTALLGSAKNKE